MFLYTLTMPAQKASATAITTYTDSNGVEQCMLMVYEYDRVLGSERFVPADVLRHV